MQISSFSFIKESKEKKKVIMSEAVQSLIFFGIKFILRNFGQMTKKKTFYN
jgi:hypothetical protein